MLLFTFSSTVLRRSVIAFLFIFICGKTICQPKYVGPAPADYVVLDNDVTGDYLVFQTILHDIQTGGGNFTLIFKARPGTGNVYQVGNEIVGGSPYYLDYQQDGIFDFLNLSNITVRGDDGVKPIIRYKPQLHLGYFGIFGEMPEHIGDWNLGDPASCQNIIDYIHANDPVASQLQWNCTGGGAFHSYAEYYSNLSATPKPIFFVRGCNHITVQNLELDGNKDNMILGGETGVGHPCYEFMSYGFNIQNSTDIELDDLNIHHMGTDAVSIENDDNFLDADNNISLTNCQLNYNGRNGLSWLGGNGLKMTKCQANYNAGPYSRIKSSPGAGMDFEQEAAKMINGRFTNCEFLGNNGHGLAAAEGGTYSYSGHHYFSQCKFGYTSGNGGPTAEAISMAMLLEQGGCVFKDCFFYGFTSATYDPPGGLVTDEDKLQFYNCTFTDCYKGNLVKIIHPNIKWTANIDSKKAVINHCNFYNYHPDFHYDVVFGQDHVGTDPANYMQVQNNCVFKRFNSHEDGGVDWGGILHHCNVDWDCEFDMHFLPGGNVGTPTWIFDPANTANGFFVYNYRPGDCEMECAVPGSPVITADHPATYGIVIKVCERHPVLLSGNTTGWQWYNNGVPLDIYTQTLSVDYTGEFYVMSTQCNGSSSNHILIEVISAPYPSVVTANGQTTFCQGGSVLLHTSIIGTWHRDFNNTITDLTNGSTYEATTSGDYFVTRTNECGTTESNRLTVTVNPGPAASVIAANGSTALCPGGSVVLTGNTTGGTWSVVGGTASSITVSQPGDYYTTTTNSCGSVESNHVTVTVNPLPVASVIAASGPTTFCADGSVVLTGNTTGGTWSVVGGTASSITVSQSGDYYTTTTNSCGSVESNHITVTINPLPVASVIAASGPTTFCAGGSVVLTGNTTGGTWSVVGGTASSITVSQSGDYYTTSTNSCGTATSNHINLIVNAYPTVTIGSLSNTTNIAPSVTLSGSPTGGVFSGPGVSGNSFNPAAAGTGTHTITYSYTSNGCTSTASTTVTVSCGFSAGSVSGPTNACIYLNSTPDPVYTVSSLNASAFNWSVPAGATVTPIGNGSSASVHFTSAYASGYVSVTVTNACNGNTTVVQLLVNTGVPVMPGVISVASTNACLYPNSDHQGTYSIAAVTNATSYNWTTPDGVITSGQGSTSVNVYFPSVPVPGTTISVQAVSPCGTGPNRTLNLVRILPSTPPPISGLSDVCAYVGTNNSATYSTTQQSTASYYTWTAPPNASISSGQGSTSAGVSFLSSFNSGNITVVAVNGCGTSNVRNFAVHRTPDAAISGNNHPCANGQETYSTTAANGYSYVWLLPSNVSGSTTTNPTTLTFGPSWNGGWLSVTITSDCGSQVATYHLFNCTTRPGNNSITTVTMEQLPVVLFPNPSDGNFNIQLDNTEKILPVVVSILNQSGELIYHNSMISHNGRINLDLKNKLVAGTYQVSCISGGKTTTRKLVVIK